MARSAHRSHTGTGNSGSHSYGEMGEQPGTVHSSGGDMRPQPHEIPGTVGGVRTITGPTLTGPNIGPMNAPVFETEKAEGNSGEL